MNFFRGIFIGPLKIHLLLCISFCCVCNALLWCSFCRVFYTLYAVRFVSVLDVLERLVLLMGGVWCFAAWVPPAPEGGLIERASPFDFLIVNNLSNID